MTAPLAAQSTRQPGIFVYLGGVATSVVTLWLVRLAADQGANVLGWYVNGIIPVGALLVGLCSGAGYAIASYWFNIKLTKSFVLGMLSTGLVDYALAQYFDYQHLLAVHDVSSDAFSFGAFLKAQCENMTFGTSSGGTPTELGSFGYVFKALEIAGFTGGTMLASAALLGMPYCKGCQRYLMAHEEARQYSPTDRQHIMKAPDRSAALEAMVLELAARGRVLAHEVNDATLEQTIRAVKSAHEAEPGKSAGHVRTTLKKCPSCDGHHLKIAVHYKGIDSKPKIATLATIDKARAA